MLDRSLQPDFQPVETINIPTASTLVLDNGIPMHLVNIGTNSALRIECLFEPGAWNPEKPVTSFMAIKMLTEGTTSKTANELSELFDTYGAFTELIHSADQMGIAVYCLSSFLPQILPHIQDLLTHASYPENEWEELKNISIQQLRVSSEQNSYVAISKLKSSILGKKYPYGYSQTEADIQAVTLDDAKQFYADFIGNRPFQVFVAGKIEQSDIQSINDTLGQIKIKEKTTNARANVSTEDQSVIREYVEKAESLQTSIRLGRKMFNRLHPHYFKTLVTNELLGGYFGSRLMKNIREEKGLTYSISSQLPVLKDSGYLVIGADVKKEFARLTVDEIHKEIDRLRTELVSQQELSLVKNVMAGDFARSLSTAFEVADRHRIIVINQLPIDYYHHYIENINAVTAEDIQFVANEYLNREELSEILVG